jgi:hypothetical protein
MALFTPEAPLAELDDIEWPSQNGTRATALRMYVRWILAAMSGAAAVVHFAFASAHFSEYWAYGAFFVAAGWFQLTWAIGVVARPSRLLIATGVLNLGIIAAWALSRTVGVGFGPHGSATEAVALPDVLATVLEGLIVIGAVALALRPGLGRRTVRRRTAANGAVALAGAALIALGTMAVTPRFAGAHGVAGHVHAGGAAHTHALAGGADGTSPCEKAGPPASVGQVQDASGHNHRGPTKQLPIDAATRLQLQQEQVVARSVAAKYPTLADAEQAGYHMTTTYVPCIGAHYSNFGYAGKFEVAHPSELLYDGMSPTSHIVGLSYLILSPRGAPEGFAGPNDHWHQHNVNGGLCINSKTVVVGAEQTSAAECVRLGGHKVPLPDIWMLHDWIVPGFECSWGVFAPECPELGGRIGGTAYDAPDPKQPPIPQG